MIVSLHMATGAAVGRVLGSRLGVLALGPLLHAAGDRMPHEEVGSTPFEAGTGAGILALLAATRGPLDPATLGAAAASAPDLEHVLPLPRPGGRELFPTHRFEGWHGRNGVPVAIQLLAAGLLVGLVVSSRGRRRLYGRDGAVGR